MRLHRYVWSLPWFHAPEPDSADERRVWLRLNHRLLDAPGRDGATLRVDVPQGVVRAGANELSVWSDVDTSISGRPVVVLQVFVEAMYGKV